MQISCFFSFNNDIIFQNSFAFLKSGFLGFLSQTGAIYL